MKRLFIISLILAMLLLGCSSEDTWKPEEASKEIRPYIERAIEIIDNYLSFDISQEDAKKAFTELSNRISSLNITEIDSGYSDADKSIAYEIKSLTYGNRTDLEYHQSRDILSFQIGKDVSGKAYPVEKESDIFEDEPVHQSIKEFDAPASRCLTGELSNNALLISIDFDAINGIKPSDVLSYTNTLIDITSEIIATSPDSKFDIWIDYQYYSQCVFSLHISTEGENVNGFLIYSSDSTISFNSSGEIATAVEAGAKYFGDRNVPTGRPTPSKTTTSSGSNVDILEYPSAIGTEEEKLMIPICPDEIFSSTAEENELEGTLYRICGTVTDITTDSEGNVNAIFLRTHKGNVVIGHIATAMAAETNFEEIGEIDKAVIEAQCPMPKEGEFCWIFAEYQGFSENFKTPFFVYGGRDYLIHALLSAAELE